MKEIPGLSHIVDGIYVGKARLAYASVDTVGKSAKMIFSFSELLNEVI